MYGNESKEDGEIRFHYKREERTGHSEEPEQQNKPAFFRLFRMNRSTIIILLDVIVLTVIFMIFRPVLMGKDHILETDTYRAELSGFRFDERAFVNIRVEAVKENPGGPITGQLWSGESGEKLGFTDTAPQDPDTVRTLRFELPDIGDEENIHTEVILPGMKEPKLLSAKLKE